jgi:hypothetical protein
MPGNGDAQSTGATKSAEAKPSVDETLGRLVDLVFNVTAKSLDASEKTLSAAESLNEASIAFTVKQVATLTEAMTEQNRRIEALEAKVGPTATSATLTARRCRIRPQPRTRHDRPSPALSDRAAPHHTVRGACFRRRVRASSSNLARTAAVSFGGSGT